jgi:2,5-diketo-D-gluconate reductase A
MPAIPAIALNDGRSMPQLGFGVWQVPNHEATAIVREALDAGYRSIDTAAIYGNEEGVGEALRATSVPREDLFITTKLWNNNHGYEAALGAFSQSLDKLKLEFVDLYLIHWPVAGSTAYLDAWRALIKLKESGKVKSIGVSNFQVEHLQRLESETGVMPAVNQIELHPRLQQKELRAFHAEHNIATEAWSPLGQGTLLADDALTEIARKHGKTSAQVILRWHLDNGIIAIPKSATASRIRENIDVFDFTLDADDLQAIGSLDDRAGRIGPDPEFFA